MARSIKRRTIDVSPVQAIDRAPSEDVETKRPQGAQPGVPIKRYTRLEADDQMRIVEELVVNGYTERQMLATLKVNKHDVSLNRVRVIKSRVHERMKLESERTRPLTKEKQLRRLYTQLRIAQGKRTADGRGWTEKPNWSAITRLEETIARVEGNYEPLRLDVDVVHREALTNVLGDMTEEQALELSAAYDAMMEMALSAANATNSVLPSLLPAPSRTDHYGKGFVQASTPPNAEKH